MNKSETVKSSAPRSVRHLGRFLFWLAVILGPIILSQFWPMQYWLTVAVLVAGALLVGLWRVTK
jgi:uncharacterized membrane protein YdbT with pleckstrin-like domain